MALHLQPLLDHLDGQQPSRLGGPERQVCGPRHPAIGRALEHFAVLKGITDRRVRRETVEALLHQTNLYEVRKVVVDTEGVATEVPMDDLVEVGVFALGAGHRRFRLARLTQPHAPESNMTVEDCLPADLRGPTTTITRIAAGFSGAGVYRVEAAGKPLVLKVASEAENDADWRRALHLQRLAADAGLAPRIVHVDEARRAVLTAFVVDRSFVGFYMDPRTHEAALTQLGRTVRRIHTLPLPADAHMRDPREFLAQVWDGFLAGFALPGFVGDAVQRVLAEDPRVSERSVVLSHNDLNPTNLVYDGEAILLLDWATAGPMDAFYDLAVLAVFLRMDEGTSLRLLSAYEGRRLAELPDRFKYTRRLAAALAGSFQLHLARQLKHAGATGTETLDSTPSLGEFYQRMQAGALKLGTADGHWGFGLGLLKESLSL